MRNKLSLSIILTYLSIGVVALLLREFWLISRNGLHVDESLSFVLSSYSNIGYLDFPKDISITGDQLRAAMWFSDGTIHGLFKDVSDLWVYNRDQPHSNLYYTLLRIWFGLSIDSRSLFIMMWAGQLNILLYIISFSFLAALAYKITNSHILTYLCVIMAFFNHEAISNSIFLRPYQLQETLFIVYFYATASLMSNTNRSYLYYLSFGFITALTLLSGYFAIILVGIISIFIVFYCYLDMKGDIRTFIKRAATYSLSTIVFGYIIYPPYLFVKNYRKDEAISKASSLYDNALLSLKSMQIMDNVYFMFAIASAACLAYALYRYRKCRDWRSYFAISFVTTIILWCLLVMFFSPYKISRYIYPIIPLASIVYVFLVSSIRSQALKVASMSFVSLACLFTSYSNWFVDYQFREKPIECSFSSKGNVAFVIWRVYRMNEFAECLGSSDAYYFTSDLDRALKSGAKYIVSDHDFKNKNLEKVESVSKAPSYYNVYKVIE